MGFEFLSGCRNPPLYKETRVMLGTYVEVKSRNKDAAAIVFDEIKRIESLLSKYESDSEISLLNKTGYLNPGKDTMYVMAKAKEFWRLSDGMFDVSVGPLVDLWGFKKKDFVLPDDSKIADTLVRVGFDKIIINEKENLIQLKIPGMEIDLGAIGKGYAVDCAVKKIREKKITGCLINVGGHIYGLGRNLNRPWHIAIRDPREKDKTVNTFDLTDKAAATSGNYEQYFIRNNVRYAHIINPKTGYPVDAGVISVTVIADDCLTADALATAIFALGKEKGSVLAERYPDVKIEIIDKRESE